MKIEKAKLIVKKFKQIRYCEKLKESLNVKPYTADLDEQEIDTERFKLEIIWLDSKIKALQYEIELM